MENKMLIDAAHPEETRVVVVRGNRVEEFDFEAEGKKQLKGNIYLAKVTRVEPSLQAAFVDYGGNRHGFLAFSEIHPDYYQIPVADRQALLKAEAEANKAASEEEEEEPREKRTRRSRAKQESQNDTDDVISSEPVAETDGDNQEVEPDSDNADEKPEDDNKNTSDSEQPVDDTPASSEDEEEDDHVESVGSEDALEEVPERRSKPRVKHYKIQEVIKRRQIILVQVVKEERGNKGAALTTYLSLAGRYSVLMPNTDRGGGISRKITNHADRKRLRTIAAELDVAEGMGVILRTAGASRTKPEIRRDFEYLLRLWENVRDLTLKSSAPSLMYEEGSLIKRTIRDLYNKDIKQVLVSGDEGYREAKDFMRMLMPSHAKNVQRYKDLQPIYARYGVESQLDAMFSTRVTLKSGGYIIINQTEALVSIDVNSGRSTRENSIEDTAFSTNLETAEEVARQLRLRDLSGLIVIDFIDMEENRHKRAVERKLKDCLRNDRARIQVGRISHFGLLEMSRQRIRSSMLESTMELCPHCEGTGYIRDPSSIALHVLRDIEDYLNQGSKHNLVVRTKTAVALFVMNYKRSNLTDLEQRFGLSISFEADETLTGDKCTITRGTRSETAHSPSTVTLNTIEMEVELALDAELDAAAEAAEAIMIADDAQCEANKTDTKRRRKRGRKASNADTAPTVEESIEAESLANTDADSDNGDDETEPKKKRRRRGRRGGRRDRKKTEATLNEASGEVTGEEAGDETPQLDKDDTTPAPDADQEQPAVENIPDQAAAKAPTDDISDEANNPVDASAEKDTENSNSESPEAVPADTRPAKRPRRRYLRRNKNEPRPAKEEPAPQPTTPDSDAEIPASQPVEAVAEPVETGAEPESTTDVIEKEEKKPAKSGWWQRRSFF